MKRILGVLLLVGLLGSAAGGVLAQEKESTGTLTLSGAWAIYPTAVAWAQSFQKLHPKVKIDVSAGGAGKGAADAIAGLVDIGMVSREPDPSELKKGITAIYILHDAVFPVISEKNPALAALLEKGVKKQTLVDFYVSGVVTTWDEVSGSRVNKPLHIYTRSDACGAASSWAAFLGKKQEDLKGVGVYGDPGLLETVRTDGAGIGFNNFSYVFNRDGSLVKGIRLLPIDSNENGVADAEEVYEDRGAAIKAIRSGRYPVTRRNYFFVKGRPQGLVREFIEFALSAEGEKIVNEIGASLPLASAERDKVLESLK